MNLAIRFFLGLVVLVFAGVASKERAFAQDGTKTSLSDRLKQIESAKLAQSAREKGNVVRGAILFHQGNINCAKCHRSSAEADRLGPDLSLLDPKLTDAHLVESILWPSKQIKVGFEPVVALTVDGRQLSGFVVKNSDDALVLRGRETPDQLITIARDDLEEVRPGTLSTMPDGLADELRSQQQFYDLVRYVIEIKERGPKAFESTASSTKQELAPELKGLVLIQEHNCGACHKAEQSQTVLKAKQPPNLKWSSKRLNPKYLQDFIADPAATKPGTTMPHVLSSVDAKDREVAATVIAKFLTNEFENQFEYQPVDTAAASRGHRTFHSVGCVACHAPRNQQGEELELADSKPLGVLTRKYNVEALVEFLEDPVAVRHSGRMPAMNLTHNEAVDLANFLLQGEKPEAIQLTSNPTTNQLGRAYISSLNCASCHTELKTEFPPVLPTKSLAELNVEGGCLSGKKGRWPEFLFDEDDREHIKLALSKLDSALSTDQQIQVSMTALNCIACHDRDGLGGISDARNPHFQTTNMNLGDQGRIPPTLTGVGAKLKRKWMRDVLVNGRSVRPYMNTRMPQYGESNVGHLIELFQESSSLPKIEFATFDDQKEIRKTGLELAGNKGLNCVACHTYKFKSSDTMPAVDLTEMAERLKKDWFYHYMLQPQKFSPNTVMPSFWPNGVAIRKDLAGTPEDQIEALWQYLLDGRQAGTPRGVVRKPLEIVVTNEPQILRRSYPGIGKRGIGVGFPGGINMAFDAEQMRLALMWEGKFVEASGVWRGQGHGNVRPLGRPVNFPKGPDVDLAGDRWVVDDGRPPKHIFRGYDLDSNRQPTFHYELDGVKIQDAFQVVPNDSSGQVAIVRTMKLVSPRDRDDLSMRVIAGETKTISMEQDSVKVGKNLRIVVEDAQAKSNESDGTTTIEAAFELSANQEHTLRLRYLLRSE